jgi:uncharacterized membrane protein YeaQ/YmgE (transglycosylase-associated protein family)
LGYSETTIPPSAAGNSTPPAVTQTATLTAAQLQELNNNASLEYAGSIGSYVGGQIALLIENDSAVATLATNTGFSTVGELISQEIENQNLTATDLSTPMILGDFAINATDAIGGFAGATAGEALFQSLGLSPTLGQVIGTTVGAAVATYAYAELAPELGLATTASTNFISDLSSGLPGLGVSAFEEITGINPATTFGGDTQDAEIGSEGPRA